MALLFTAALQAQEAGHWHELDDTYAECLLCKSGADAQLTHIPTCAGPAWLLAAADEFLIAPAIAGAVSPFHARGPPARS